MSRRLGPSCLFLVLLGPLFLVGCGRAGGETRLPAGTPIVLVSIDTLRSDRLPAYGYRGVKTPAIDRLRDDSILFEHAYCPAPLTLPSHASLLTGLLPPEHGVRDNMGYRLHADEVPYLPRALKQLGYHTGAAVSSFVLRGASGLASDFDFYEDRIAFSQWARPGDAQRPGSATLRAAVDWLREVQQEPFFLFFHLYEPHAPYEPPEPFASRYANPYDGEVAAADAVVGELLGELERSGLYDRSLIVLLSDHGEGLRDHGDLEHGPLLYREVLQVPLLLKLPGGERGGSSVAAPAQLTDVFPTLLALLETRSEEELSGTSLLALAADEAPSRQIYSETFFPRLHFGWSELSSLIEYPYHLIEGPDPELYDLERDPKETRNLVVGQRRRYARLKRALAAHDHGFRPPAESDPEDRRKLAALGYLGGFAGSVEGPLPDPKSRLASLDALRQAMDSYERHDVEQAIVELRAVVAEEPLLVDAWEYLGQSFLHTGRLQDALQAYRQGLEASGGSSYLAAEVAGVLLKLGRLDEARAHAELAVRGHEAAYDVLAQVAMLEGNLDEAERHVERAVASRGARIGPLITQADLLLRQDNPQDALAVTDQVLAEAGPAADSDAPQGLHLIRGKAFARTGEAAQAEESFLRELEVSPRELAPYTHLALLYAVQDRAADAGRTLGRMVEANPTPAAYAEAVRTLRLIGDSRAAAAVLRQALRRWPESRELRELAG